MARIFLAMKGKRINSLDDLRNNFDASAMMSFYRSGRLQKWLEEIGAADELENINSFEEGYDEATLASMLMAVFDLSDEQIAAATPTPPAPQEEPTPVAAEDKQTTKTDNSSRKTAKTTMAPPPPLEEINDSPSVLDDKHAMVQEWESQNILPPSKGRQIGQINSFGDKAIISYTIQKGKYKREQHYFQSNDGGKKWFKVLSSRTNDVSFIRFFEERNCFAAFESAKCVLGTLGDDGEIVWNDICSGNFIDATYQPDGNMVLLAGAKKDNTASKLVIVKNDGDTKQITPRGIPESILLTSICFWKEKYYVCGVYPEGVALSNKVFSCSSLGIFDGILNTYKASKASKGIRVFESDDLFVFRTVYLSFQDQEAIRYENGGMQWYAETGRLYCDHQRLLIKGNDCSLVTTASGNWQLFKGQCILKNGYIFNIIDPRIIKVVTSSSGNTIIKDPRIDSNSIFSSLFPYGDMLPGDEQDIKDIIYIAKNGTDWRGIGGSCPFPLRYNGSFTFSNNHLIIYSDTGTIFSAEIK